MREGCGKQMPGWRGARYREWGWGRKITHGWMKREWGKGKGQEILEDNRGTGDK